MDIAASLAESCKQYSCSFQILVFQQHFQSK